MKNICQINRSPKDFPAKRFENDRPFSIPGQPAATKTSEFCFSSGVLLKSTQYISHAKFNLALSLR